MPSGAPRSRPSVQGDKPKRTPIEVCCRCLWVLKPPEDAQQIWLLEKWYWSCADGDKCAERQAENKVLHRKEIDGRLKRGRGIYTHLVVVLDHLGFMFGYGNYYVGVKPDEKWFEIAEKYINNPELVIESVITLENG